jgi:hypothetical protein
MLKRIKQPGHEGANGKGLFEIVNEMSECVNKQVKVEYKPKLKIHKFFLPERS